MIILNGATNGSPRKQVPSIAWYASGENVGTRLGVSKTCLGQGGRGFFPPEARAEATVLACHRPEEKGVPLARWSYAEIGRQLIALGLVVYIAASTIGRWLAAEKIRPWRYHNWQHVVDPQAFLERARPVLELYGNAKEWLKEGVWIVGSTPLNRGRGAS